MAQENNVIHITKLNNIRKNATFHETSIFHRECNAKVLRYRTQNRSVHVCCAIYREQCDFTFQLERAKIDSPDLDLYRAYRQLVTTLDADNSCRVPETAEVYTRTRLIVSRNDSRYSRERKRKRKSVAWELKSTHA